MARRKKTKGFGARRSAEAESQRQEEQARTIRYVALGVLFIAGAVWGLFTLFPPGGEPEPAAVAPLEGDRPLAELDPAARDGYFNEPPPTVLEEGVDYSAVIRTEKGDITVDLFEDVAPETVNNFIFLAQQGFYDGTTFHRVIDGFMAQAGDPSGTGRGGPGYMFGDEIDPNVTFDRRGLLAMANAGPGTNGSQFFITYAPTPHLNGGHTIFGELTAGDDVLDQIRLRNPAADPNPGDTIERIDVLQQ